MGTAAAYIRENADKSLDIRYKNFNGYFEEVYPILKKQVDDNTVEEFFSHEDVEHVKDWKSWDTEASFETILYLRDKVIHLVVDYQYMIPTGNPIKL